MAAAPTDCQRIDWAFRPMVHTPNRWEPVTMTNCPRDERCSQRGKTNTVKDNPSERRYEINLNGELAGYCTYQRRPGMLVFTHTEIEARFRGRGIGSRLIGAALMDAERRGLKVLPRCEFVQDFIRLRPDPIQSASSSL
jgi:uncharacterized protein